jgi:hypothetical protein
MPLIALIEEKILEGMRSSCNDTFLFLENESQKIGAEYLLTVNVAKKLADLNQYIGHPYKIYLERKTRLIASDCVPLFAREVANNFLGYRQVLRKQHNTSRNGKADITLYKDTGGLVGTPVCVIELKGFDPSRTSVLHDLRRNSEYFKLVCRTGASQLQYTCFAAMHSFPKSITDDQIKADLSCLRTKYNNWKAEVGIPSNVNCRINVETISKGLDVSYPDENNPEVKVLESNHHFAGVFVSYARQI